MNISLQNNNITCPLCLCDINVFVFDSNINQWCKCDDYRFFIKKIKNNLFLTKDYLIIQMEMYRIIIFRSFYKDLADIYISKNDKRIIELKMKLHNDYKNLSLIFNKLNKIKLLL